MVVGSHAIAPVLPVGRVLVVVVAIGVGVWFGKFSFFFPLFFSGKAWIKGFLLCDVLWKQGMYFTFTKLNFELEMNADICCKHVEKTGIWYSTAVTSWVMAVTLVC